MDNCPLLISGIKLHEVLRVSKLVSYFIHCGCAVIVPVDGIIEIIGSKQWHNSPYFLHTYATDETQSIGSTTGVMTKCFTILSNFALTLGCMEIVHFDTVYNMLGIATKPDGVLARKPAYAFEPIWEFFDVLCRLNWSSFLGCWWWCWCRRKTWQLGSVLDDWVGTVHLDNF